MKPDLFDILSSQEVPIDNEQLARYLHGHMDEAAKHAFEKQLQAGAALEADAWEGWQQAGNAELLLQKAEEINQHLTRQLHPPKKRARKKAIYELPVVWWVVGLIFGLIVVAWFIISRLK